MQRIMCKSKIHRATVTQTDLNYEGSIAIDLDLMEKADILPGEQVQVVNLNNGERIETYAMAGEAGSGVICLNGAAARHAEPGDKIIIMSFGLMDEETAKNNRLKIVFVDEKNKIK
ncbi:aspartate 1-decarboxylase [bacterium]|nr:aspartate 1-decarboxylase [bacterium]